MLSPIGGMSTSSYVRSDMSGEPSVKHKGGIKNNYREMERGSNAAPFIKWNPCLPPNISLWGGLRSSVQGCNDGRNHKRS